MADFQHFTDPKVAQAWDSRGSIHTPTRPEQLDILISLIHDHYQAPHWILDLGSGSGLVEEKLFQALPTAKVLGVDHSQAMMALAAERLAPYGDHYQVIQHDLSALEALDLSAYAFQMVMAVQSLHHLAHEQMPGTYAWIYRQLQPGGYFFLLDRMQVQNPHLWSIYQSLWQRQDRLYQAKAAEFEGASFPEHEQKTQKRGDLPARPEQHIDWLHGAGFQAEVFHLHGNRALIIGIKI